MEEHEKLRESVRRISVNEENKKIESGLADRPKSNPHPVRSPQRTPFSPLNSASGIFQKRERIPGSTNRYGSCPSLTRSTPSPRFFQSPVFQQRIWPARVMQGQISQIASAGKPIIIHSTGQPDYSIQWADYYRAMGLHKQAVMVENQLRKRLAEEAAQYNKINQVHAPPKNSLTTPKDQEK